MSICLCYKSAEATASVHWQGADRVPLSELHEAAPGNTLSASTERLPTAGPTLLHERRRKRAIPTLAEPPPLGSDLDRHWRPSTVQKRKNYHKYAFCEINISRSHYEERRLSVCTLRFCSPPSLHRETEETILSVFYSTSGVSWADWGRFQVYFEGVEHLQSLLKPITNRVGKLLQDLDSHTSNDSSFDMEPRQLGIPFLISI